MPKLDLRNAKRIKTEAGEMRSIKTAGGVWMSKHTPLYYGVGLGEISIDIDPSRAVVDDVGKVTSIPNSGGAGSVFDLASYTSVVTIVDGLLAFDASSLRFVNRADCMGAHTFFVVSNESQGTDDYTFTGSDNGNNPGEKTSAVLHAGLNQITFDRWNGVGFDSTLAFNNVTLTPELVLLELEFLPGTLQLWRNGVSLGTLALTAGWADYYIDRIGQGRTAATWKGKIGRLMSVITDGGIASSRAVHVMRDNLADQFSIALD